MAAETEYAFPQKWEDGETPRLAIQRGMTLRDWFAGQALATASLNASVEDCARRAYQIADAMMAEREID